MSKANKITTPPMRRVPADEDRHRHYYVDPKHAKATADGWNRLREILEEAMQDKTIAASGGASDFLELIHSIVEEPSTLTAENNVAPLKPLTKEAEAKAEAMEKLKNKVLLKDKNKRR